MKDFNLFSIYDEKSSNSVMGVAVIVAVAFIAAALPIMYYTRYQNEIADLREQISFIDRRLKSDEIVNQLSEYEQKNARIEKLGKYADAIERSGQTIERIGTLKTADLKTLAGALPVPAGIENFTYSDRDARLTLLMPDRAIAPEILVRLKDADCVEDATLSDIKFDESIAMYRMTVNCRMKEGVLQ